MHGNVSFAGRWDHRRKYCPVVASRLVLKSGKHTYKVQIIAFDRDKLLSTHGLVNLSIAPKHVSMCKIWVPRFLPSTADASRLAALESSLG
jgi:hypothetical protein